MREHQFGLDKTAHRVADEIEQRQQFAGCDFGEFWPRQRPRLAACFDAFGHQDLVQRAAAASSCSWASTQLVPLAPSSRFQNGALAFR